MTLLERSCDWIRITLFLDESLEQWLIEQALERGAVSYICTSCSGKPPHVPFEDLHACRSLVRVELLAPSPEAGPLLTFLERLPRSHYPVTVVVDPVTVCADYPEHPREETLAGGQRGGTPPR